MLHFTPHYKPSKGSRRGDKWEGDIGVSCCLLVFSCLSVQLDPEPSGALR